MRFFLGYKKNHLLVTVACLLLGALVIADAVKKGAGPERRLLSDKFVKTGTLLTLEFPRKARFLNALASEVDAPPGTRDERWVERGTTSNDPRLTDFRNGLDFGSSAVELRSSRVCLPMFFLGASLASFVG